MYNVCGCLRRRIHLSIHSMYRNHEQGLFSMFVMSRWYTEKCHLYSISKHCVHLVYSRLHVQHHYKCCDMYNLLNVCCWNLCVYSLFNHCK